MVSGEREIVYPMRNTVSVERGDAIRKYIENVQSFDPGRTWKRRKRSKYLGIRQAEVIKARIVPGWE